MIKIWADSLDKNFAHPRESLLFVKDLIMFCGEFEQSLSAQRADVIVIPQYSNNYINNLIGNYVFDNQKADYLFTLGKPIIIVNTGGGTPQEWSMLEIWDYIQNETCKNVIIFSTECYGWHRNYLPKSVKYLPYDYTGFVDYGLGLRTVPPLCKKSEFLHRQFGTAVAMNAYPPTRDKLWELVHEQKAWTHFTYRTIPDGDQTRIDWNIMVDNLYKSKIGFAPDGATGKTERHLFVPSYTVMMKQEDGGLEFAFKWLDGINCIEMVHDFQEGYNAENWNDKHKNWHTIRTLNKEKTTSKIINYLSEPEKLYDIYFSGWFNDENYRIPNYNKNYISKQIKENI